MLRDYQLDVYKKIRKELVLVNGVCAVLPCRSGKTYIIKRICDDAEKKGSKVLVLAHRHLLINQHKKAIQNCRIESVFTEVNHLGEHGPVDLIIIDEGHLSEAASYKKVCEYYGCKVILFTATAKRLDNKPLTLCNAIINGISGDELIDMGYISPYELYAPKLSIDLSHVSMSGADYNSSELAEVMIDKKIYGDIIKYYHKLAEGKQSIAYCTNVKHSQSVCELFNSNGIPAKHIDSTTPEKIREQVIAEFKRGDFKVLCNCNLISEGITLPECECCMLLRPTQSETLYIQQACRCLTPSKDKVAVIIDFVGNCYAHGTPTELREYTLDDTKRIRNSSREPEVVARECKFCYRVYKGNDRICPYCGEDNGKTKKQIKADEKAELERIEQLEKKRARMEVGMCKDYAALVNLAKERGYKYPSKWARNILEGRRKNKKGN